MFVSYWLIYTVYTVYPQQYTIYYMCHIDSYLINLIYNAPFVLTPSWYSLCCLLYIISYMFPIDSTVTAILSYWVSFLLWNSPGNIQMIKCQVRTTTIRSTKAGILIGGCVDSRHNILTLGEQREDQLLFFFWKFKFFTWATVTCGALGWWPRV